MKFPRAEWRGPVPCTSAGPIHPRLVVLHIMAGSLSGTDAWFLNPKSKVSAHFGTGKDGKLVQWVDANDKAWAQGHYNGVAISIENEGHSGDSLTPAQVEQCAQVLAWAHSTFGVLVVATDNPDSSGLIGHGQLGARGGNHPDCPGAPILSQRGDIVARAAAIVGQPSPVPAPPNPEPVVEDDMQPIATDPATGDYWVLTGPGGGLDAYNGDGIKGNRFFGNLYDHPDYNAGEGKPNGPAVWIEFWPQGKPAGGYVIFTRDAAGDVHPYHFDEGTRK